MQHLKLYSKKNTQPQKSAYLMLSLNCKTLTDLSIHLAAES